MTLWCYGSWSIFVIGFCCAVRQCMHDWCRKKKWLKGIRECMYFATHFGFTNLFSVNLIGLNFVIAHAERQTNKKRALMGKKINYKMEILHPSFGFVCVCFFFAIVFLCSENTLFSCWLLLLLWILFVHRSVHVHYHKRIKFSKIHYNGWSLSNFNPLQQNNNTKMKWRTKWKRKFKVKESTHTCTLALACNVLKANSAENVRKSRHWCMYVWGFVTRSLIGFKFELNWPEDILVFFRFISLNLSSLWFLSIILTATCTVIIF